MRNGLKHFVLMYLFGVSSALIAQSPPANREGESTPQPQTFSSSSVEFSRPKIVADLNAKPTIAGRFDCSEDGSIYTFIDGYAPNSAGATPKERLALLGIHPDGSVTSLPWRSAPGYRDISLPKSVYVGNGDVYVLVEGTPNSVSEGKRSPYPLVLKFDQHGSLIQTAVLEQGLDPLTLGAFRSGNVVVISEDRLNQRMALDLVRPDGTAIRQLDLGSNDYLAMQAAKTSQDSGQRKYNPALLISMSKFFPFGDDLLLVPLDTSGLPIVELGEQGVVKAMIPQLPEHTVIESFVSSSPSALKVRLGTIVQTQHPALDPQGELLSVGTTPAPRITELSLADGKLLSELDIGSPSVQPVCEAAGALRLLTSSGTAGKLAVVTAQLR